MITRTYLLNTETPGDIRHFKMWSVTSFFSPCMFEMLEKERKELAKEKGIHYTSVFVTNYQRIQ